MVSSWAHLPWITDVDSSFLLAPNTYKRTRFNRLARVDGHKGPSWVLWAGTTSMETDVQAATTSPLSESRPPSPLPSPPLPRSAPTHLCFSTAVQTLDTQGQVVSTICTPFLSSSCISCTHQPASTTIISAGSS